MDVAVTAWTAADLGCPPWRRSAHPVHVIAFTDAPTTRRLVPRW